MKYVPVEPLKNRVLPKSTTAQRSKGAKKANRTKWEKPIPPINLNWGQK